jgi:L-amino acid N-acyltransferase YncA
MMIIRPATPRDCPEIARIQVDSYRSAYAPILPATYLEHFTYTEQAQDWQDWFAADNREILYVALTQEGNLTGYALGKCNPDEAPPYESELVALHVRQEYQRQGLGRQLFSAVSQALLDQGSHSLFLWTIYGNPSRTWSEKLGGQLIGEKAWENNVYFGINVFEAAYGWPDIRA